MSIPNIYAPLGHGSLVVQNKDYVWRTVPPGCMYITLAYSAEKSYTTYIERFRVGLKDPAFYASLKDPANPDNYVKLREFMEEMPFYNVNASGRKPPMEEHGILSILRPGDIYPEAGYMLISTFHDDTVLLDSGFYNIRDLRKKPIREYMHGQHIGLINKADIEATYKDSIIAPPADIMESFESDPSLEVIPGYYRIKDMERVVTAWPLNVNEDLNSLLTILEIYLRNFIKGKTTAQHTTVREYHTVMLGPIAERVSRRLEKAGIRDYPVMFAFLDIVGRVGALENNPTEAAAIHQLCKTLLRTKEGQRPGEYFLQSVLFENYPGIHINVLCRWVEPGSLPVKKIVEQRAKSASRRAERYNTAVARATAGYERLPPVNVEPANYLAYRAEQAAQRATAMRILQQQSKGANRYMRNLASAQTNRNIIKGLRKEGATEEYIRSLFPARPTAAVLPSNTANIRRTIRARNRRSINSNAEDDVVFEPKFSTIPRATRRNRI